MTYTYRINGEERFPTDEERMKLFRQFVTGLGFRPVVSEEKETEEQAGVAEDSE